VSQEVVEIAVIGDTHGFFAREHDEPLLRPYALRLCTGDLAPNGRAQRLEEAVRQASELRSLDVHTILGNHDGPTAFTGRKFPEAYFRIAEALGDRHLAMGRLELPGLDLTLIGARPLTCGGRDPKFPVPGCEDWTTERWGEAIGRLLLDAEASRIVVLAHDGPAGLGSRRHDIYGCDFRPAEGDWGDRDLRIALDAARGAGRTVSAVVAGHMHHDLFGGGTRTRAVRERGTLHLNAAIVPRVTAQGRALFVLRLEGAHATARLEWHRGDGGVRVEEVVPVEIG
jgi:uncharacterized protein (TIGR04168 family)